MKTRTLCFLGLLLALAFPAWSQTRGGPSPLTFVDMPEPQGGQVVGLSRWSINDFQCVPNPGNPPTGLVRLYCDSGTGNLTCLNSSGLSCLPSGGAGNPSAPLFSVQVNNGGVFGGLALGASGAPLISGGAGAFSSFTALNLAGGASAVTGILPAANLPATLVYTGQANTYTAGPQTFPGGDLFSGGVNEQTGASYTVVASDENKLITFANAGAVAVTLPQATTAGFTSGAFFPIFNEGPGTVTITSTTSTINDAATLVLTTGTGATIYSDGTNYSALIGGSGGGSGTVTSVAQTVPSGLAVAGSPITTSGTLAVTWSVAAAGQVINSSAANTAGFSATPTLGVAGTTLGTLTLSGNTSGTVLLTPQAAAGTPTITFGTSSGTPAVTASAPLSITTATGNITCATCATSSGGGTITWATPTTGTATSIATFPGGDLFNGGVDAQSGTSYTVVAADENKLLTFNNASAVGVTLPQATTAGFTAGAYFSLFNRGAGAVTITPTTSTINGNATLVLNQNQGAFIVSDGTNYSTWVSSAPSGSGTVTSVAQTFTGGLISVAGSPITTSGTLALTVAGTSGGIPYFNSATTWASSALLAANGPVIGGGAGTAPSTVAGPTTPNSVPEYFISTPSGGLAQTPTFALAGVPTNAQTGTSYTLVATDRASYLSFSNASSIAVTLPQAGSAGFGSNFVTKLNNIGVGAVTVTPTTSTIDGNATMVLNQGESAFIYSDNTNYFSARDSGQLTASTNVTFTRSATGLSLSVPISWATPTVGTATSVATFPGGDLFNGGIDAQTGTSYTVVAADENKLLTLSNASAVAVTLPQATTAGFTAGAWFHLRNLGVGTVTITPTTSTIDGAATLVLTTGQGADIYSDGTNYNSQKGAGGGSGTVTSFSAGNLSPLFTTSVATATTTPALTFSLSSAAAGTFLGNNTSAAAAPSYVSLSAINPQTTTYQVLASDFSAYKTISVASGTFTITLVASGSQPANGQYINIVNYGSGVVTIARSGQNINGAAANYTLNAGSASAPTSTTVTSDGTNYFASIDEGTVGTVTSIATTSPITGGTITTSGTIACATCATSASGGTITWATPTTGTATSIATFPGGDLFFGGVDAQSGTSYTVVAADENKLLTFNNASAVSVTLPQATGAGFVAGAVFNVFNRGAGAVTITPTTSTINGSATVVLNQNQGAMIESDGTNYSAWVSSAPSGSGTVTSVAETVPLGFAVSGSPITTSGTLGITYSVSGSGQVINSTGSNAAGFTATPTLGLAGTTVGTLAFANATSGSITVSPATGALGSVTLTLPDVTATIVATATSTTATQALFATTTAGAPNFRAIAIGDLPSIPINNVVSATGPIVTIANGNNPLVINCALTSGTTCATFGETTAATTAGAAELQLTTLTTSTAIGLQLTQGANGPANANAPAVINVSAAAAGGLAGASNAGSVGAPITLLTGAGSAGGATTGIGGAGGAFGLTTGAGGAAGGTATNNGGSGGGVNFTTGAGGNGGSGAATAGSGGGFTVTLGAPGTNSATGTAGTVGQFNVTGNSPASTANATGVNAGTIFNISGVTGGADSAATGTAGNGSVVSINSGNGGAASGGTAGQGGVGGAVNVVTGNGGASTGTGVNPNGGNFSVTLGKAGIGGSGTAGATGQFNVSGTAIASSATSPGLSAGTLFLVNGLTGGGNSTATGTAGVGSLVTINSGTGGTATGATAGTGGAGGALALVAGAGGVGSGTGTGGVGGAVNLTAGAGGNSVSTSVNSNGGSIVLTPGAAGTGGSGAAGLAGVVSVAGANAGFIGLTQGSANTTLNTNITANTIIDQAPTAVTAYTQTRPTAASSGLIVNVNASNVITQTYTGDASHSVNLTAQTAAKTTTTLCAATAGTACGQAGQYHVHWNFWGSGTACATPGPGAVTFLLTWTDENAVTHSAVSLQMVNQTAAATTAMGSSFTFASALANESASGDYTFSTNGTIIQYATGYTACTTGTGTYGLRAAVEQLQ